VDRPTERRALPPDRSARHVLPRLGTLAERRPGSGPLGSPSTARPGRLGARRTSAALRTGRPRRPLPLVRVEPRPGTRGGGSPRGRHRARRRSATPSRLHPDPPRERPSGV